MTMDIEHNRREFLRNAARVLLLALLGLGTGALVARRRGEDCVNVGICRGCPVFGECGLPQALSAKDAGVKETTWRKPTTK